MIWVRANSGRLSTLVRYVRNGDKTEGEALVSGVNCAPGDAARQMLRTKEHYAKEPGIQAYHVIQAFLPEDVDPKLAHRLGEEFVRRAFPGFEAVVATHVDGGSVHNHMVVNSVSLATGLKYHFSRQERDLEKLNAISQALCAEHGLHPAAGAGGKFVTYIRWEARRAGGMSANELVDLDIQECLGMALDTDDFYSLMNDRGYLVDRQGPCPRFTLEGMKPMTARQNGRELTEEDIGTIIEKALDLDAPETQVPERPGFRYERPASLEGLRALYGHWLQVLDIVGKGGIPPYPKVTCAEVRHVLRYRNQQRFLEERGIDGPAQLKELLNSAQKGIGELLEARKGLDRTRGRHERLYKTALTAKRLAAAEELWKKDPRGYRKEHARHTQAKNRLAGRDPDQVIRELGELKEERARINGELKKLRSVRHYCSAILAEAPKIDEKMEGILRVPDAAGKGDRHAEQHERTGQGDHGRPREGDPRSL